MTVRRLAVIGCDTENKETVTIIKSSESVVKCQKLSRVGTQFLGGYSSLKGGVSFARFLSKNGSEAWGVSMVLIIREAVTPEQINQMTEQFGSNLIKLAVDVKREIVAGGGELHSDCEQALLEDGSQQIDVWEADWHPESRTITFESIINLRPQQQNFSMEVQDLTLRRRIEKIVRGLLEVN